MKKICVIGHPVAHSRSPLIHGYWLKKYGMIGQYERRDIPQERFASFLQNLQQEGYDGCNITIPHKEAAAALLQNITLEAKKARSVNTVWLKHGQLFATSSDGAGFYQNLLHEQPDFDATGRKVLILGAGGSARAIAAHLAGKPFQDIVIANRTYPRACSVAQDMGNPLRAVALNEIDAELANTDLLINTTPRGMAGSDDAITLNFEILPRTALVADIVYVPLKTIFLAKAEALGLRIVPGLGMLLHQAVPGFEHWFGIRPEVTAELYHLVASDLNLASRT